MTDEIEKKLNQLVLENNTKEIIKFFNENIKKSPILHQFEFLFWLTDNKNLEVFKFLLDFDNIDIHMFEDFCFCYSAGCGYLNMVKFFLKNDAFIWMSSNGHLDVVQYLVSIHSNDDGSY